MSSKIKWILASASPRRRELLTQIGLSFEVVVSEADENIAEKLSPGELVERLSLIKAGAVRDYLSVDEADNKPVGDGEPGESETAGDNYAADGLPYAVIGADTVVYHEGEILGKPKDEEDAFRMLRALSGATHSVFTGVSILLPDETVTFHSETKVTFDELSDEEIRAYIASGEPMDKAGAYGIQGLGGAFVTGIEGEYANVVGFPIGEFCRILRKKGLFGY
jgi:septum formation protein